MSFAVIHGRMAARNETCPASHSLSAKRRKGLRLLVVAVVVMLLSALYLDFGVELLSTLGSLPEAVLPLLSLGVAFLPAIIVIPLARDLLDEQVEIPTSALFAPLSLGYRSAPRSLERKPPRPPGAA